MRELEFLTQPHAPQESPGLESTDEQLASISKLVDEGEFSKAADRVEDLVRQGIFDIRLLVFLFHASFLEEGFGALTRSFEGLTAFIPRAEVPTPKGEDDEEYHVGRVQRCLVSKVVRRARARARPARGAAACP